MVVCFLVLPLLMTCTIFCTFTFAQTTEPSIKPADLPRVPPTEPADALKTFRLKPGLRIELVAAEPLIADPIAMSFDENGRLFVVEMRDYSERRDDRLGRIKMLTDTDGDGRFDKTTIYAQDLPWPTAVFCYGGGVFVGSSPDLLYYKDTNGDGVADQRKVIFTGFGAGLEKLNVQAQLNSFTWGLDNRIHAAAAANGGLIVPGDNPTAAPINLRGRGFSFDPRSLTLRPENGGGQYAFSFDDFGRAYVNSNANHIQSFMYDARYAARNPLYAMPAPLLDIGVDGPSAPVFRISPEEPWRVIRTQWRVAGQVKGPIEGGGRASGYFTSACGLTVYRGAALGDEFRGDVFICEPAGNLVHRKKIRPDGVGVLAQRPADEADVEFLASTDNWFRPCQVATGPDGALYIADMYREIVEHPWSLPESMKKILDLNSGNDRGRIYRIVPDSFNQPQLPKLGQSTTAELVATLAHPNGWHRDTAARLLCERHDRSATPHLVTLLEQSPSSVARLHALYALDGLSALTEDHALRALSDPDPALRRHGLMLSERFLPQSIPTPRVWSALKQLASDPDLTVRYQLAFTIGQITHPDRSKLLADIARRDCADRWMQAAILSSPPQGVADLFAALTADASFGASEPQRRFLQQLVILMVAKGDSTQTSSILSLIEKSPDPAFKLTLAAALGDGLARAKSSLTRLGPSVEPLFQLAEKTASDRKAAEPLRVQAVALLAQADYDRAAPKLASLLQAAEPQAIQLAAVSALDRFTDPRMPDELVKRWPLFTPRLRNDVIAVLLKRPQRAAILLTAIESSKLRASDLNSNQVALLKASTDPRVRQLAGRVLTTTQPANRQDIVDKYLPSLALQGDPVKGKAIFLERCISCHRLGEDGNHLGPDLTTVRSGGKEKMLTNILDPNREVAPQYLAYVVDTKDGDNLLGIIADETPASLTVRQAYGTNTVILRSNIKAIKSQRLALMPESLEENLTPHDLANLLEFISTAPDPKP